MVTIVVIGGGIVGASIARTLSKYENILVHIVEKEVDVGWGATKANTGIIHPGHEDDPAVHPLRAKFCVKGNQLWKRWAEELDIPTTWPGELMIIRNDSEYEVLEKYLKIGKQNGVTDLRIIDKEEILELEPNINPSAIAGLWAPTAGLIEPWEAVIGLVENAVDNGVIVHLNTLVTDIVVQNNSIKGIETDKGMIRADIVINAAGLFADSISKYAGIDDVSIHPRKGEYYLFDKDVEPSVERIVHRAPTEQSKGVYAVRTVEGNLMLGPTAEDLCDDAKDDRATSQNGLDYVWNNASDLVKDIPSKAMVSKIFAGLRPEPPGGRYVIKAYDEPRGFINVAGMRSPGLTAAPAIAEHVVQDLMGKQYGVDLVEKKDWNPQRTRIQRFSALDKQQQNSLIKKDHRYGNVVCMCNEVTEGEIIEAISRMKKLGTHVCLDSIKFRTVAMFGFCQGSFCRSRIARILSRELEIPLWKVTQMGADTEYGIGDIKSLQSEEVLL